MFNHKLHALVWAFVCVGWAGIAIITGLPEAWFVTGGSLVISLMWANLPRMLGEDDDSAK